MDKKKVAIVVMSNYTLMDFAGPADVFRHAGNLRGVYDVILASPVAGPFNNHPYIPFNGNSVMEIEGPIDTLLITGDDP